MQKHIDARKQWIIEFIEEKVLLLQKIPIVGSIITAEIVFYLLVGSFSTLLDFSLYWAAVELLGLWYLLAAALIRPVTLSTNYLLHRQLTFQNTDCKRTQLVKYLTLVVINYFAALAILYFAVDIIGFDYLVGRIIVYVVVITWNYAALKLFVFREKKIETPNSESQSYDHL